MVNLFFTSYARDRYGAQKEVVRELVPMLVAQDCGLGTGRPLDNRTGDYAGGLRESMSSVRPMLLKQRHNLIAFAKLWGDEIGAPVVTTELGRCRLVSQVKFTFLE